VKASRIDVETSGATKTVTLKGTVATEAQKEKAPGYQITNDLRVEAQPR
jgi:osmotically-inducible protein OsmY